MTSGNRLKKLRKQAAQRQGGYCFYCRYPMWDSRPEEFIGRYGISPGLAKRFQCTAEHLKARCDGGEDIAPNIVAACHFCNTTRHKVKHPLDAAKHASVVRLRLAKGRWHPPQVRTTFRERRAVPN
ncbi:MAG: restriction endonuclease [Hoeflea sp.]|nr:MAG: restriction endonuclease [Hoeflea sp.]